MTHDKLEQHILATYFTLRIGVAIIAVVFPFILWIGGHLLAGLPLLESMSAYYYPGPDGRSMRDWFVGILFAVGVCLYLYKGYSTVENVVLNCAGTLAVGIAIFPSGQDHDTFSLHGIFAVSFFLCIAFVCVRCAGDTLSQIPDEAVRRRFRHLYKVLGMVMIASPAMAFGLSLLLQHKSLTFYIEAAGIFAFAAYWLTKSREISITESEKNALRGQLVL